MSTIAPLARGSRLAAVPRRLLRMRSDAALAERFAAGDEAAFAVLYERHRSSVLAVCIGVLGCRDDAEDAAQEVFASLAVALRGERPRELRPWLVRVARNAAIDARRRRRSRAAEGDMADTGPASDGGVRAELESVLAAVRELPESQRTALLMRELAGHSYEEIGGLLGCDEEAVRGLIARARIGVRNHREASELPCTTARQALAAEPDGRRQDKVVRRHVRRCASCQAYRRALRADSRALHGLRPGAAGGLAGGGAVLGAAAKGVLAGGALTQAGAACAVSLCSAGGIVLLAPHLVAHPPARPGHGRRPAAIHRPAGSVRRSSGAAASGRASSGRSFSVRLLRSEASPPLPGEPAAVLLPPGTVAAPGSHGQRAHRWPSPQSTLSSRWRGADGGGHRNGGSAGGDSQRGSGAGDAQKLGAGGDRGGGGGWGGSGGGPGSGTWEGGGTGTGSGSGASGSTSGSGSGWSGGSGSAEGTDGGRISTSGGGQAAGTSASSDWAGGGGTWSGSGSGSSSSGSTSGGSGSSSTAGSGSGAGSSGSGSYGDR